MMLHNLSSLQNITRDLYTPKHQTEFNVRKENTLFSETEDSKEDGIYLWWYLVLQWATYTLNPERASVPNGIIIIPSTLYKKEPVKWISPVSCITLNLEAADLAQKPRWVHLFGEITSVFRNLRFYGDKRQRLKNFQRIFRSSSELFVTEITLIF